MCIGGKKHWTVDVLTYIVGHKSSSKRPKTSSQYLRNTFDVLEFYLFANTFLGFFLFYCTTFTPRWRYFSCWHKCYAITCTFIWKWQHIKCERMKKEKTKLNLLKGKARERKKYDDTRSLPQSNASSEFSFFLLSSTEINFIYCLINFNRRNLRNVSKFLKLTALMILYLVQQNVFEIKWSKSSLVNWNWNVHKWRVAGCINDLSPLLQCSIITNHAPFSY